MELSTEVTVTCVDRERGARGDAYIVHSRHGDVVLLGQKLTLLADEINKGAAAIDRVSTSALYAAVTGGVIKHRWKVDKYRDLNLARCTFERMRNGFKTSVVVGTPVRYALARQPGR